MYPQRSTPDTNEYISSPYMWSSNPEGTLTLLLLTINAIDLCMFFEDSTCSKDGSAKGYRLAPHLLATALRVQGDRTTSSTLEELPNYGAASHACGVVSSDVCRNWNILI